MRECPPSGSLKIRDGISRMHDDHYANEEHFFATVRSMGERFRIDKLASQEVNVRCYCEAEGMLPQVSRTLSHYSVPVFSGSGFDSLTAKHDLARWCHDNFAYRGKTSVVMHLGDHDPSGVSIFESVRDDVHALLAKDIPHKESEQVAEFRRVALTKEMVASYQLPTAPPK